MKRWSYLIVWLVLCFGAGALGAGFGPGEWYARLSKPGWTPPGWLFAPVWTVLYALMAVAAWLVSTQRESRGRRLPVMLFSLQLAANAAWPWLFFGLQRPGLALVDLVLLWLLLSLTVVVFIRRAGRVVCCCCRTGCG